jgi:hypothetical protein
MAWTGSRKDKLNIWLTAVVLISHLAVAGCGGDDDPTNPTGGSSGTGSVTATIDGAAWSAGFAQAVNNSGIVGVGSSSTSSEKVIGFGWVDTGASTYTIAPGSATNGTVTILGGSGWSASGDMGSGTVNVTTLTATRVAGTFSFTAPRYTGTDTPDPTVVTNGSFDVEF